MAVTLEQTKAVATPSTGRAFGNPLGGRTVVRRAPGSTTRRQHMRLATGHGNKPHSPPPVPFVGGPWTQMLSETLHSHR
jgi:hypothetical protein